MKSVKVADLSDLQDDDLVIIDTKNKSYKLIIHGGVFDEENLEFRTHLLSEINESINMDEDNEIEYLHIDYVFVSKLKVNLSLLLLAILK